MQSNLRVLQSSRLFKLADNFNRWNSLPATPPPPTAYNSNQHHCYLGHCRHLDGFKPRGNLLAMILNGGKDVDDTSSSTRSVFVHNLWRPFIHSLTHSPTLSYSNLCTPLVLPPDLPPPSPNPSEIDGYFGHASDIRSWNFSRQIFTNVMRYLFVKFH